MVLMAARNLQFLTTRRDVSGGLVEGAEAASLGGSVLFGAILLPTGIALIRSQLARDREEKQRTALPPAAAV
jgi:hypothetical protein